MRYLIQLIAAPIQSHQENFTRAMPDEKKLFLGNQISEREK